MTTQEIIEKEIEYIKSNVPVFYKYLEYRIR